MQGIESLDNFKNFVSSIGGLGRFEDTYIVHAAEGETVVPMEVLNSNPVLKERLFKSMRDMGIEPERYVVGNELNSINPITGQPEFFLKQIGRRLKKAVRDIGSRARKAAADVSGYAAPVAGAFFGAPAGALVGGLLGQYKRENPGDPNQALQMALRGGVAGLGANLLTGQSPFTLGGGLRGALRQQLGPDATIGFNPLDLLRQANSADVGLSKLFTNEGGTGLGRFRLFDNFNFSDLLQQANLNSEDTVEEQVEKGKGNIISALFGGKALPLILAAYGTKKLGDAIKEEQEQAKKDEEEAKRKFNENLSDGPITALLQDVQGVNLPPSFAAQGGVMDLRQGGESEGPGTGTSDDIPAMLSDGEFVMTAKAVRGAGGGDRREGAKQMYQMMDNLEARA